MNEFKTSDFGLAASLQCSGCPVVDLERNDPKRINFIFMETEELKKIVDAFWRGELRVNPLTFMSAQKVLKSRLYSR